jgi:hypothetical protein
MNLLDLLRVINLLTDIHKPVQDYFSAGRPLQMPAKISRDSYRAARHWNDAGDLKSTLSSRSLTIRRRERMFG